MSSSERFDPKLVRGGRRIGLLHMGHLKWQGPVPCDRSNFLIGQHIPQEKASQRQLGELKLQSKDSKSFYFCTKTKILEKSTALINKYRCIQMHTNANLIIDLINNHTNFERLKWDFPISRIQPSY